MRNRSFHHRVQIEELIEETNSDGILEATWVFRADRWCRVVPLSVREMIAASSTKSKVSARIDMRYCDWLTPTMRILHRGKVYNIEGILPDFKSGLEFMSVPVSEGLSDGR